MFQKGEKKEMNRHLYTNMHVKKRNGCNDRCKKEQNCEFFVMKIEEGAVRVKKFCK